MSLSSLAGLHELAVYVSQDGNDTKVQQLVERVGQNELAPPHTKAFTHWQRERIPLLGEKQVCFNQGQNVCKSARCCACALLLQLALNNTTL